MSDGHQLQENVFEQRAGRLLQYLKSDIRYDQNAIPRPFFVEFTGSPSSGKTTTITELDKFFRRMGFRVLRPQEGAEVVRHITRDTPLYNLTTGDYAKKFLVDEGVGHKYDLVIFDRCIFDAYVWMMYWEEKGKLTREECVMYQGYFLSRFWADNIDAAYFMICDPDEAMHRELRIALSQKLGETTNPETIRKLVNRYQRAYETLRPAYPQLHLIDTAKLSEQEMVTTIANKTFDILEQKIKTPT